MRRAVGFVALAGIAWLAALAMVASEPGYAAFPGVNGRVAYSTGGASPESIWTANADGSFATRLAGGDGGRNPSFSPDGTRIAFERWMGSGSDVLVMNANGSGEVLLAAGSLQNVSETRWEEGYETSGPPPATIPFVKVTTTTTTSHSLQDPSFSPDGSRLAVAEVLGKYAYTSTCAVGEAGGKQCIPEGEPGAYFDSKLVCVICTARIVAISSTSGARIAALTEPPNGIYDLEPTYSTDGKLAFRREGAFGVSSIFVMGALGSTLTQVTFDTGRAPDFSPDGSKIAFDDGDAIGIVGAAGGPVTTIPVPDPPGGEGFVSFPAFSPDGTRIAFDRSVSPQGTPGEGLYTIGVDGSGMALVSGDGHAPSWQPLAPVSPPPPAKAAKAKRRKGKVRLNRKGLTTIGTIVCGSSPCTFSVSPARLKTGGRKCAAATELQKRLRPEKSAPLRVRVVGKCLAALSRAGKGNLVTGVRAADGLGERLLTVRSTLVSSGSPTGRAADRGLAKR